MPNDFDAEKNREFTEYFLQLVQENSNLIYDYYTTFSEMNRIKYNELLAEFKAHHAPNRSKNAGLTTRRVGDILEDLVTTLFSVLLFQVANSVKTDTNEIDHLITLNLAVTANFPPQQIVKLPSYFICECKNYDKTVSVTWINKFHSLMESTNTKLGILFSYHGFSGSNISNGWQDAAGFARKVLIKSMGKDDETKEIYILDFSIKELDRIGRGKNILDLIYEKKLIQKHNVNTELRYEGEPHQSAQHFRTIVG